MGVWILCSCRSGDADSTANMDLRACVRDIVCGCGEKSNECNVLLLCTRRWRSQYDGIATLEVHDRDAERGTVESGE